MRDRILSIILLMITVVISLSAPTAGNAGEAAGLAIGASQGRGEQQIMIRFRSRSKGAALLAGHGASALDELSQAAGEDLVYVRPMSGGAHVLALAERRPATAVAATSARLAELPEVEYATPARVMSVRRPASAATASTLLTPNDARFDDQWHYEYTPGVAEGLNLPPAWAISSGSADTVVAVIDTGILNHPDLADRTLPGYDFVSDVFSANDGDGWDDDPSDPGDWVSANECGFHPAYRSSWHGTHVAGTVGAASNNGVGVAGVNWQTKILPVRVLGKCGGTTPAAWPFRTRRSMQIRPM
jgi:serine protease